MGGVLVGARILIWRDVLSGASSMEVMDQCPK